MTSKNVLLNIAALLTYSLSELTGIIMVQVAEV